MVDLSKIEVVVSYRFCDTDTGVLYRADITGGITMGLWKRMSGYEGEILPGLNTEEVKVSSPEWMKIHSALAHRGIIGKETQDGKK